MKLQMVLITQLRKDTKTFVRLERKNSLTYIVISHDEDVLKWCDNIVNL